MLTGLSHQVVKLNSGQVVDVGEVFKVKLEFFTNPLCFPALQNPKPGKRATFVFPRFLSAFQDCAVTTHLDVLAGTDLNGCLKLLNRVVPPVHEVSYSVLLVVFQNELGQTPGFRVFCRGI